MEGLEYRYSEKATRPICEISVSSVPRLSEEEIEDFKAAEVNCISGIRVDVEKTSNAI